VRSLVKVFKILDADENGTISLKEFMDKRQWLNRKYPALARHFRKMDLDSSASLDLNEFLKFAESKQFKEELRRGDASVVHDIDYVDTYDGAKFKRQKIITRRNEVEPRLKCELVGPCYDVHQQGHRYEWSVGNIEMLQDHTCGKGYSTSIPFRTMGSMGVLRLWPNGYLSNFWNRLEYTGWACLGIFFPRGVRLKFRFFINDTYSEWRDVFFDQTTTKESLWDVPGKQPKEAIFGVEIWANNSFASQRLKSVWRRCYNDISLAPYFAPEPFEPEDYLEKMKREKFGMKATRVISMPNLKLKHC